MMGHPIESLMRTTMESLKSMVDVNTVVGEPVETKDGTVIIPVSRVSFGFVAGGGDETGGGETNRADSSQGQEDYAQSGEAGTAPFTGGSGAGVSVKPVGFLVVGLRKVRFIPVDNRAIYDRLLDEAPELLDRFAGAIGGREGAGEIVDRIKNVVTRRGSNRGHEYEDDRGEGHYGEGRTVVVRDDNHYRRPDRNGR